MATQFSATLNYLHSTLLPGISVAPTPILRQPFCLIQPTLTLKRLHNSPSLHHIIRARIAPDDVPDAQFYKVEAILRPWRIPQVSSALLKVGIRGVTVSDVRGFGAQGGSTERQAGSEFCEDNFVAKVKMEIVVSKDQVEAVIEKIIEEARTGEIGDGKIFSFFHKLEAPVIMRQFPHGCFTLVPVSDVIRVRTGERGLKAERMSGGRAEMFPSSASA